MEYLEQNNHCSGDILQFNQSHPKQQSNKNAEVDSEKKTENNSSSPLTPYARRPIFGESTNVVEIQPQAETTVLDQEKSQQNAEDDGKIIYSEEADQNEIQPEQDEEEEDKVECDLFELPLTTIHEIQDVITVQKDRLVRKAYQRKEDAERLVRLTKTWVVCHFNHLPKWLQDNEYLHVSHRPQLESFKECFQSIFRMHSETGNIWTHLIGCFIFLIMAVYVIITLPRHMLVMDKFIFGVFFIGAILCLLFSFLYHTVSCHSPKVGKLFSKLDYIGISLLITGSFVSCIYYMFYCNPLIQLTYLIFVSGLCLSSIIVSLWDKFSEPNFRTIRASVFIVFGCSGIIPAVHWFVSAKWNIVQNLSLSFIYLILMGTLYILGALLYAGRVPERFFPGKCDYWFQSHQIFHILVIVAALLHYQGIYEMAAYRLSNTCEIIDPTNSTSTVFK